MCLSQKDNSQKVESSVTPFGVFLQLVGGWQGGGGYYKLIWSLVVSSENLILDQLIIP